MPPPARHTPFVPLWCADRRAAAATTTTERYQIGHFSHSQQTGSERGGSSVSLSTVTRPCMPRSLWDVDPDLPRIVIYNISRGLATGIRVKGVFAREVMNIEQ